MKRFTIISRRGDPRQPGYARSGSARGAGLKFQSKRGSSTQLAQLTSGGDDVRLLSGRVPNLNVESTCGRVYPRFYIRGIGNEDFTLNAQQPVAMYYDEVVLENAVLKGMPVFDLERVEVLRGPQGSLWVRTPPRAPCI